MNFSGAVKTCFRKYVTFSGRAGRPEYWWFFLFGIIGSIVAGIVDAAVFGAGEIVVTDTSVSASSDGPVATLFSLVIFLPGLSAGWRRMHDTGRSGLYLLYPLIALLGILTFVNLIGGTQMLTSGDLQSLFHGVFGIVLFISLIVLIISPLLVLWWLSRPSQPGPNQWGPNPNEVLS